MSSAPRLPATDDLTARARIRDAAIRTFAEAGMTASLRSIAAEAGVSAALILHHFGSRDGLRQACDQHVHTEVVRAKGAVLGRQGAGAALLAELAGVEGYAALVGYALRVVQAGDAWAAEFVEGMVQDTLEYFGDGEASGTVRPSRWPEPRARMLVHFSLGSLLLNIPTPDGRLDLATLPGVLRAYTERFAGPALELYTEPLLTDSSLFDTFLSTTASTTGDPQHTPEETP